MAERVATGVDAIRRTVAVWGTRPEFWDGNRYLWSNTGTGPGTPDDIVTDGDVVALLADRDKAVTEAGEAAQRARELAAALVAACDWIEADAEPMVAVAAMRKTLRESPVG